MVGIRTTVTCVGSCTAGRATVSPGFAIRSDVVSTNWHPRRIATVALVAVTLSFAGLLSAAPSTPDNPSTSVPPSEAQVREWIDQLGDSQYPNREKAQEELRRAGTVAFDLLIAAQDHADVEIAQRARYLIRSIAIPWVADDDPTQVKSLLSNFSSLSRNERKTRAQHLSTLEGTAGIVPLCRVVRFEPDRVLSKQAALHIMSRDVSKLSEKERQQLAEMNREGVALSSRPAIKWLTTYARELEQPGSTLADWNRISQSELAALARTPQRSDREVVRGLIRWQTKLLLDQDRAQEALVNFRKTYSLMGDTVPEIHEAMDWALENKLHQAPQEIAAKFPTRVNNEPQLLYRLAESQLKGGNAATAEATANAAMNLKPGRHDEHLVTAMLLYQRSLIDWSANEYRKILSEVKVDSEKGIEARITLAEMLFDAARELEAADTLKPLVEHIEQSEKIAKETEVAQIISTMYRGSMHYYYAVHFGKQNEREKQKEQLKLAIESYPANIDILIAMYRVPDTDDAWKKDVQTRIDAHLGKCRTTITQYEEGLRRQPNMEAAIGNRLATAYNELAWLISNTDGDVKEAVRGSERSLELDSDNAAYMDTLARCYFAAGELHKAIEMQRRALKIMPHLQVMQRQLKLFEDALAAKAKSQT